LIERGAVRAVTPMKSIADIAWAKKNFDGVTAYRCKSHMSD